MSSSNPVVPDRASVIAPQDGDESDMERLCRRGRIGLARIRVHKSKYWEIDFSFPHGMAVKRLRIYRRSATAAVRAARSFTKEIREHGRIAREMTTTQRAVAALCFTRLAKVYDGSPSHLLRIVDAHLARHPLAGNARTLDDVRREVVDQKTKTKRSERHVKGLDYKLRCLIKAIGNKAITLVTTSDLESELENHPAWSATTVHSAVQSWKIMFNFAVRRGYLAENPADKIELPKIIHDEPTIFSVDEVRRLMAATLFSDRHPFLPACRAYLAIGMFSGLRPDEISRLEWKHVCLATRTIRVKTANAKDRDRRIVDISPNLAAWLAPIAQSDGHVLTRRPDELRAAARSVLRLAAWPQDVMRHTFASYHFAAHRNEAATKHQMGHRDDGRIFYNHYCVPVSHTEAQQFWGIIPPIAFLTHENR